MIDKAGTVKIIDFGATRVAGIEERSAPMSEATILGTAQYMAPEYFVGELAGAGSDLEADVGGTCDGRSNPDFSALWR
jgi:serine/threonine protein kinase